MTEVERLVAIEEIKHLRAQSDRALDTKDWRRLASLHMPDHVWKRDIACWNSSAEMVEGLIVEMGPNRVTVHRSQTPEIIISSEGDAFGTWAMEDMIFDSATGNLLTHGFGFYHETYVNVDGRWFFKSRELNRTLVRHPSETEY